MDQEDIQEVSSVVPDENSNLEELESNLAELVEFLKNQHENDSTTEKLDELLDYLIENEEKQAATKEDEIEKLSNIEELLSEEELTEEQQAELEALLAEEETFYDLQKSYYAYQNENLEEVYTSILETNEEMITLQEQQNELIVEGFLTLIIAIVVVSSIRVLVDQISKW